MFDNIYILLIMYLFQITVLSSLILYAHTQIKNLFIALLLVDVFVLKVAPIIMWASKTKYIFKGRICSMPRMLSFILEI